MRNYKTALSLFSKTEWSAVCDHLRFTLGRQSYQMNDIHRSLLYFIELVANTKQSSSQQAFYLKELLFVLKVFFSTFSSTKAYSEQTLAENREPLPPLKIPVIESQSAILSHTPKLAPSQPNRKHSLNFRRSALFQSEDEAETIWKRLEKTLRSAYSGLTQGTFIDNQYICKNLKGCFDVVVNGISISLKL
jgi:hypothetical protein